MVFWEGRGRHSSSYGQRAAILGNAREEGISPFPPVGPSRGRNENQTQNSQRARKGA